MDEEVLWTHLFFRETLWHFDCSTKENCQLSLSCLCVAGVSAAPWLLAGTTSLILFRARSGQKPFFGFRCLFLAGKVPQITLVASEIEATLGTSKQSNASFDRSVRERLPKGRVEPQTRPGRNGSALPEFRGVADAHEPDEPDNKTHDIKDYLNVRHTKVSGSSRFEYPRPLIEKGRVVDRMWYHL